MRRPRGMGAAPPHSAAGGARNMGGASPCAAPLRAGSVTVTPGGPALPDPNGEVRSMKKITVRKTGSIKLTSSAGVYQCTCC
ncbi:hypothetical protein GCM10009801_59180 [Streptomyces albiaxialis]|uniref:Uncharacterized protein n=1 Tax=Streptomyces albiaxialis TaxID=329523 RepID=A0ABN2WIN2_9ACTN